MSEVRTGRSVVGDTGVRGPGGVQGLITSHSSRVSRGLKSGRRLGTVVGTGIRGPFMVRISEVRTGHGPVRDTEVGGPIWEFGV